jgi:hypothetical protein
MEKIFDTISYFISCEKIGKASEAYNYLLKYIDQNYVNIEDKGVAYVEVANFMFQKKDFLSCIDNLKRAQENSYPSDQIERFIFDVFIGPNIKEFKQNYKANSELFKDKGIIDTFIDFEDLDYFFIPTFVNDQYFVFDKQDKKIGECVSLQALSSSIIVGQKDIFADHLITSVNDFCQLAPIINGINNVGKRAYLLPNDMNYLLSFLQLEELSLMAEKKITVFPSEDAMKKYFMGTSCYLPRNIQDGTDGSTVDYGKKIVDEIHKARLTRKGRNGSNVLLTIGIPSWNRGHRAFESVVHSLTSYYDEEIEILVSDNATQNKTVHFYQKIESCNDARVRYTRNATNLGFGLNLYNILQLAKGKFTLFISDEDLIFVEKLQDILRTLKKHKESLAVLRCKSNGQVVVPSTEMVSGIDAFNIYGFTANYLSGIILNTTIAKKYELGNILENNTENIACLNYPHMVLEIFSYKYGNVKGTDTVLIDEGIGENYAIVSKDEYSNVEAKIAQINSSKKDSKKDLHPTDINEDKIPDYAKISNRVQQLKGWLNLFPVMNPYRKDKNILRLLTLKISWKTIFLVALSHKVHITDDQAMLDMMLKETLKRTLEEVRKFYQGDKILSKYFQKDKESIKKSYQEIFARFSHQDKKSSYEL